MQKSIHIYNKYINNIDGNLNISDIGSVFILPYSYTSSSHHIQEYIQDAMNFVCTYGRYICNINF